MSSVKRTQAEDYNTLYTLYGFRVTDRPVEEYHSAAVYNLIEYFSEYLHQRRFPIGFDAKLQQAIADYPELPELRNFRIVYLGECGRGKEGLQASRDLFRDFPNYLFARTGLAQLLIQRNELAEVDNLLEQPRHIETLEGKQEVYHESAVHAYYSASVALALALGDPEAAAEQLPIVILTRPEHPITRQVAIQYLKQQRASRQRQQEHDDQYERIVENFSTAEYESTEEPPMLHHAELEVFYQVETANIDAETVAAIRTLPRATLRADLEAILIDSIRRYGYFSEVDLEEEEHYSPLHAFYWLGTLGMEESLPIVLDWLRQGEDFINFWAVDEVTDVLFESFYPIAKNRLPDLLAYVREPNQWSGARSMVVTVVAKIALEEAGRRAEAIAWFREVARHTVANVADDALTDTEFLATWAASIIDFQGTELWPEVQELYALNLIPLGHAGELKDVKKDIFEKPRRRDTIGNYILGVARSYGKGYHYEAATLSSGKEVKPEMQKLRIIYEYMSELYSNTPKVAEPPKPVKSAPKPLLRPVATPQYQAPRNAPCPCGSGKKFKRCHGLGTALK